MIKICQPFIREIDEKIYLVSTIEDEYQNIKEEIYYSTSKEYGQYLTAEVADAFVVGMLLPAAKYNEDIVVDGAVSEKLLYNINNSILYILSLVWGNRVKLTAKQSLSPTFNSNGVGCGCSLGVDSFAAMMSHINDPIYPNYQITHLTYFNVGAMGYVNLDKARESYEKDLKLVLQYTKKVDKPVVCLESNFSILYSEFNFDQSGDMRNFSAALSMQKLFGKYLYGSSFTIKDFKFEQAQTGYYETLLAPLLSTDNTDIVIANPDMSRIEKTKFIIKYKDVQENLYVCWKELIANKNPESEIALIKDAYLNCSRCDKCLRTLLAIDILGKLNEFNQIFDIKYYHKVKAKYIAKVIYMRGDNAFYTDLYNLIKSSDFQIPTKSYILLFAYMIKLNVVYQKLKKIFNR